MVDAPCLIHPSTGPHATSLLDFYEGLKKVAARREQLARLNRAAGSSPVDSLLAAIDLHADVMPESLPPLPPSPPPDPSYVPVQLVDVTSPKGFSVLPLEEKAALTRCLRFCPVCFLDLLKDTEPAAVMYSAPR